MAMYSKDEIREIIREEMMEAAKESMPCFELEKEILHIPSKGILTIESDEPEPRREDVSDFIIEPCGVRIRKDESLGCVFNLPNSLKDARHKLIFNVDLLDSAERFKFKVLINGTRVVEARYNNTGCAYTIQAPIEAGILHSGQNTINFEGLDGPGGMDVVSYCIHYHKTIEIT